MARIQGDLKQRTFYFARDILAIIDLLPNNTKGWEIGKQLIRSGCSIGANIREADNAHTDADFANKCSIARKEAGETTFWLELCKSSELLYGEKLNQLTAEADQLTRILSAIVRGTQVHIARKEND